jgi:Transposase DDE domain
LTHSRCAETAYSAARSDSAISARMRRVYSAWSMSPHRNAARAQARTPEFKQAYPTRSMVERVIAWTATSRGRRITLRYLGIDKNHAWLRTRCAAINLRTLVNGGLTRRDGAWAPA